MTDKKISQLTNASTPLAGTEVLPIVQSATTVKTTVLDVTTGLPIAPASVKTSSASDYSKFGQVNGRVEYEATNAPSSGATSNRWRVSLREIADGDYALQHWNGTSWDQPFTLRADGSVVVQTANLVQGTAAKGINFTANTPAAGMTSQLLNWYEEGTFTPAITAGAGTITTLSAIAGTYTRIGNKYFVNVSFVITTNGTGASYLNVAGLPVTSDLSQLIGSGNENAVSGKALTMSAITSSSVAVTFYDGTYPGVNGASFRIFLTYQA